MNQGEPRESERKLKRELDENRSLNKILLENSQDGILVLNNNDRILSYNIALLKMWQLPKNLIESLDAEQLMTYILHRTINTESYIRNYHLSRKYPRKERKDIIEFLDGRIFLRTSIPHYINRKFIGRVLVIRDVTLTHQYERMAQNSDFSYGELADSLPEVVFECDMDGFLTFVNDAGFKQFKLDRKQFARGINAFEMLVESDRDRAKQNMERVLSGDIVGGAEYQALRSDGSVFPVVIHTRPVKSNREVKGLRGIAVDVSRLKAAEETIKRREKWFRIITENISDLVFVVNEELMIQYAGPSIVTILKVSPEDTKHVDINEFVHPDDRGILKRFIHQTIGCEKPQNYIEIRLLHRDGGIRFFEFSASDLIHEPSIQGIILNGRDITYRKKMEEEAFKANKLETASILAGGIAHDFNNVLTGIAGSAYLTKKFYNKSDLIPGYMEQIENAVKKAKSLTQHLLSFAKGGEPEKTFVELEDWLKNTITFSLHLSNVQCKFQFQSNTKPVEIDTGQVGHALNNILKNAVESMDLKGVIRITTSNICVNHHTPIPPLPEGDYVKISIHDSGPGIPRSDLSRVFDPYFTTKENAIGLGLSIAYTIIRKHEGTIVLDSQINKGCQVSIILPASSDPVKPAKSQETEIIHGQGKVLLMDDQKIVLDIGGEILRFLGYDVHFAGNGEEAIELYKSAKEGNKPFDVVILDLTVTDGMGGWEAFKELRDYDSGIVAIASSGFTNNPIMAYWQKYGFSGVIGKPYRIANLSEVMYKLTHQDDVPGS